MTKKNKILFVDDEPNILSALSRMLRDEEYMIYTATSADEGIALLETEGEMDIVISDYRMPDRNGVDFLREVHQRWPLTVRMILSGFADMPAVIDAINEGKVYRFLPKPWDIDELKEAIADGLTAMPTTAGMDASVQEQLRATEEKNRQLEELLIEYNEKLGVKDLCYEQMADILNALPMGLLGIDDSGQIVFNNRLAEKYFDKALVGTHWNDLDATCTTDELKQHLDLYGSRATTMIVSGQPLRLRLNYLRPTTRRGILLSCEGVNNGN